MYEVSANGNRTYRNGSAAKVAAVAAAWRRQGHEPRAYAILDGEAPYAVRIVPVTTATATETRRALTAAR